MHIINYLKWEWYEEPPQKLRNIEIYWGHSKTILVVERFWWLQLNATASVLSIVENRKIMRKWVKILQGEMENDERRKWKIKSRWCHKLKWKLNSPFEIPVQNSRMHSTILHRNLKRGIQLSFQFSKARLCDCAILRLWKRKWSWETEATMWESDYALWIMEGHYERRIRRGNQRSSPEDERRQKRSAAVVN